MIHTNGPINYDGLLLKQKFGFDFYKEKYNPNGIVVIAYGPLNIGYDATYFLNDYPSFEDAIHICWEIPNLNLKGNSFFKQVFITKIYEELKKITDIKDLKITKDFNLVIKKNEDNLLSVNINKETESNIVLGYLGLDNKTFNLVEKTKKDFSEQIEKIFYELLNVSFIDTIKTT